MIDNLLLGQDLFVVLESRYGPQYKESYNLDTIILRENRFWAKFKSVHSPMGHKGFKTNKPFSYAYNNYSDIACVMGASEGMQRFTSTNMYSRMDFKCKGTFKLVANSTGYKDLDTLNGAVENCQSIKIVICDKNGLIHIMPVHTIELYKGNESFGVDTDFESVPSVMYDFDQFVMLGKKLNDYLKNKPSGETAGTDYMVNSPFSMVSFLLDDGVIYKRETCDGEIRNTFVECEFYEVYCEL